MLNDEFSMTPGSGFDLSPDEYNADTFEEKKSKRQIKKENELQGAMIANSIPTASNLKLYIENILDNPNCEEILTSIVDELLKQEQMALNDNAKESLKNQKTILAILFLEVTSYGDQYNMLLSLSQKLGYRRIV